MSYLRCSLLGCLFCGPASRAKATSPRGGNTIRLTCGASAEHVDLMLFPRGLFFCFADQPPGQKKNSPIGVIVVVVIVVVVVVVVLIVVAVAVVTPEGT